MAREKPKIGIKPERKPSTFLFYWRAYAREGRKESRYRFRWYSKSAHKVLQESRAGDRVWAITRIGPNKYALVAQFVISKSGRKEMEKENFFRPSKIKSEFFDPEERNGFESLIRKLSFSPRAKRLGQAFQGPHSFRLLTPNDDKALSNHMLSLSSQGSRQNLIGDKEREAINSGPPERVEVIREILKRDSRHVKVLKARLSGICQLCGTKPFEGKFGDITEAHHIKWLSKGGHDRLNNMVLLCPNHHAAIHAVNSKFDWSKFRFSFDGKYLRLKHTGHLKNS